MMTFGDRVKTQRVLHGMSRAELAAGSQISPEFVRLIEQNRRKPSPGVLKEMAECFGMPPSEFIEGTDYLETMSNEDATLIQLRELVIEMDHAIDVVKDEHPDESVYRMKYPNGSYILLHALASKANALAAIAALEINGR